MGDEVVGVRNGRLWRLIVAITLIDIAIVLAGPLAYLSQSPDRGSVWFQFVSFVILVALPAQCVALWLALARPLRQHRQATLLRSQVDHVIKTQALVTAFQPILENDSGQVIGVEALSRFDAEPHQTPDRWFAAADQVGRGRELELLALSIALRRVPELPAHLYVAVNVSPPLLASPSLLRILLGAGVRLDRLVVEVTEHESTADYGPLCEARENLRRHGIRLAVDDAGAGYASFRHIVALSPDIIKIDRDLVTGIDQDNARRALVAAVVMYALTSGATVVAEGVETPAEYDSLMDLGVDAVQGYLTGRPTTHADDWAGWSLTEPLRLPAKGARLR